METSSICSTASEPWARSPRRSAHRWPDLTIEGVEEGIASLEAAGLLEDAATTTSLTDAECQRYQSNLAFFGAFAGFGRSRYSFQERLRASHVLLLGVGGIGSTVLYNLAGLGVGRVTSSTRTPSSSATSRGSSSTARATSASQSSPGPLLESKRSTRTSS